MNLKNDCQTCHCMVHPDYRVKIDEFNDLIYRCVWCATNKKEITLENKDTGKPEGTLTKKEAVDAYRIYLKKLSESEKIRKILFTGKDNPLDQLKGN